MHAELLEPTARYVELLRRHGKRDVWLPAGLMRRLPTASASATPPQTRGPQPDGTSKSRPTAAPTPSPAGTKTDRLAALRAQTLPCQICPHLEKSRTQVVFGVGDPEARLMFVGEAPGADEDEQGEPFVGRAGNLLTKMLTAMELTREKIYIANVLKCRPDMPPNTSGNRKPTRHEIEACLPYLRAQISIIAPVVIVALGASAVEGLLGPQKNTISRLRGTWMEFEGIPVRPTFHPSYLLHNQDLALKRLVWVDLLAVMERLGLPISKKQHGFFLPPEK